MIYKASLDRIAVIITVTITVFFIGLIIASLFILKDQSKSASFITVTVCLLTYVLSYGFSPQSYALTAEELIINRPFLKKKINRSDIYTIQAIDKNALSGSLRMMGVGGLFGYYGRFSNFKIGNMTWYNTNRTNAVLIILNKGEKIVITPDNRDGFVTAFNAGV